MQIAEFEISRLFGTFPRRIPFDTHGEDEQALSIVLLHGPNGSGKTTSLRMIDGLMRLDFNVFREIPFDQCSLRFSTGDEISVSQDAPGEPLKIQFREESAVLHPQQQGPLKPADASTLEKFRDHFRKATQAISFEYIHTWRRAARDTLAYDADPEYPGMYSRDSRRLVNRKRQMREPDLADRVARFISNAQVSYRRYFRSSEPDFLSAIIQRLQGGAQSSTTARELAARLRDVRAQEEGYERLGVERSRWDFELACKYLDDLVEPTATEGLSVMTAAAEVLESRVREQKLLAERLLTFERTVNGYFRDKEIVVEPRNGFTVTTESGEQLSEDVLSSGEYHLLYLMVAALTTQRRGTVLAIDEPELSMHISWQRQLIDSLLLCASNASPQLVLATHSPDVVGGYRDYLVEFGNADELVR